MLRGRTLDAKPGGSGMLPPVIIPDLINSPPDRVLDTAEANVFLGRPKGFLEKRRSSGIDSPRYMQRTKRGRVLYRVSDLLAWEEERMLRCSSDHDDPTRRV